MKNIICKKNLNSNLSSKGFALTEIVIALGIVTMAIILVGALSKQVMNMNKSSKQIAAVIEMRTKIAALSKDPDSFLTRMRATIPPGSTTSLQSCIPFVSGLSTTTYNCPAVMSAAELAADGITDADTENGRFKVSKMPLVDPRGVTIAPQYLTDNGAICTSATPATSCPFMSVGYMFRENIPSTSNPNPSPGSVKFVSRVSMTPGYPRKETTPLKPILMSIDLGTSWTKSSSETCANSKVFQGIESDGSTKCVDPTTPCTNGFIQVGYSTSGPLCENPTLLSCLPNEKPILDPVAKKLVCSSNSPCVGSSKVFTGFYAGSGEAICEDPSNKCSPGTIQMGASSLGVNPICKTVQQCDPAKEALSFDGNSFSCLNSKADTIRTTDCPLGESVIKINSDGSGVCGRSYIASNYLVCPDGKYVYGLSETGSVLCKDLAVVTQQPPPQQPPPQQPPPQQPPPQQPPPQTPVCTSSWQNKPVYQSDILNSVDSGRGYRVVNGSYLPSSEYLAARDSLCTNGGGVRSDLDNSTLSVNLEFCSSRDKKGTCTKWTAKTVIRKLHTCICK